MAFSRWFNAPLGSDAGSIRLATELEWEKAARGDQELAYPRGNEFRSGFANVDDKGARDWNPRQTIAVGLYPQGRSP